MTERFREEMPGYAAAMSGTTGGLLKRRFWVWFGRFATLESGVSMRNLMAALVFVISAAAFAVARTPADEDAHRTDAVEEPVVESTCERYGEVAEDVEPTQKRARPAWLTDYSTHIGIIGVLSQIPGSPPREEAEPVERSPFDALMDSLSPGVRASYEGWLLERKHARWSGRANAETRAHLREEAEYAAFIEERLRRLNERNEEADD